ncbi:MAG TPA: tyrosine-type recombinase/integrase [Candidatus Obscuribacterales bacterium]
MPKKSAKAFNFTKKELEKLPAPDKHWVAYHDTTIEGLILLHWQTGAKSFYVYKKIEDKPERIKIGKFPDMSVERARNEAQRILGEIAQGQRPTAKRARKEAGILLEDLFRRYLDEYAQHHCTTWRETGKNFRRYFAPWLSREVTGFARSEIQQYINALGTERGHHTANRAYDDLRAVISWGIKYGYLAGTNPCAGVTKFKTRSRERFIRPDEFKKFLETLREETNIDLRDYVYLSLFTGARQANILSMRWDQIDFDLALWHIPITKNKESQTLPLTELAMKLLKSRFQGRKSEEWVFPSVSASGHIVEPKAGWRKFVEKTKLQDLRMHDLRRTLGSYMAMNNQSLQIIGKTLGHKSPAATQIYSRLGSDPIKRAMEAAHASMAGNASILPDNLE